MTPTDPPERQHVVGCVLFVTEHAVCLLRVQASGSASGPVPGRGDEKVQIVAEERCDLQGMKKKKNVEKRKYFLSGCGSVSVAFHTETRFQYWFSLNIKRTQYQDQSSEHRPIRSSGLNRHCIY